MHRILLIDDDELLAAPLADYLRRFDMQLDSATRPSAGLAMLARGGYDAAILDVMLPEMDGFELCRTIRRTAFAADHHAQRARRGDGPHRRPRTRRRRLPAQALRTARTGREAADHPAPRRVPASTTARAQLLFDGLHIDLQRRQVQRHGEPVDLTGTEFELLVLLAREPQKVFDRDQILNRLRGHEAELHTRAVDILVSRLRRKLQPLDCIKTLRNAGYAFAGARL